FELEKSSNKRQRTLANTAALSKISTAAHAFFHRRLKCVASDTLTARLLALVVARVGRATSAIGAVECYSKESDRCPKWRGPNSKAPDYESGGRTFRIVPGAPTKSNG